MIKRKFYTSKAISYLLCICMVLGLLISFPSSSLALDIQSVSSSMILSDISGHWAETHISSWYESGLISGFPDETFKPNNAITRAEFMVLVNRAYGLSEKASINFSDTSDGDWFQDDVAIAVKAGYLVGYGDGTVRPLNNISRQEAAAIIYRLLKLQEHRSNILIEKYLDYGNISPWSREAVNAIVAEGYMVGNTDGTFGPVNKITRAETIVTLSRATGEIYKKAGIYSEIKTITGNATINTQGITLENVVIEGNLYLTPGIGKGEVLLRNVKVKGVVFVDGGGEDLVVFEDCEIENIVGSITPVILTSSGPLPPSGGSWPGGSGGIVLPITKYSLILIGDNISSSPLSGAIAENTTVTVTLAPPEGKDVNIFTVNGLDRKSQLVNNKYTFTINENTTIQVDYIDSNLPDKSVYDILFDPTGIVTGIPKEVEFTLKATEVKSEGYEKVRINVEVIQKPADSLVSLIGNYGAGPVNVIEVGYWGPESGHPLVEDYNLSYPLIATFSKAGQYTIKMTLRDLDDNTDILTKTVVIKVTEAADYPLFVDTSPQDNPRITNLHDDGFTVLSYLDRPGNIYVIVVEKDKPAPNSSQVKDGGNQYFSTNTVPIEMVEIKAYGSVQAPSTVDPGGVIFKTLLPDTEYDIYVVTEGLDNSDNLQPVPLKITHKTNLLYAGTQINTAIGYPKIEHLTSTSIKITFRTNRRAKIYYIISTSNDVNTSNILSGQYVVKGWHNYKASGVIGTIREQERSVVIEGLDSGMVYNLYAIYANPVNNLYDDTTSKPISFTTSGNKYPPVINYEIINISGDVFTIRRFFDNSNYIREYYLVAEADSQAPSYDYLKLNGLEIQPTSSPTDTMISNLKSGTKYMVYIASYWSDDPDTHTTVPHILEATTLSQ